VTRIALGDPKTVPAGRYAIEVLDHLHLTNDLKEKFVYTKDVIQALTYVRTNIAGAAFVYGSDVHSSPSVRVVATFPESSHSPILYEGVLVSSVPVRSEAERFLDFLRSDTVQALLVKDGFSGDFR
jgi:molybdate transport system substrate-binding protein